MRKVLRYRVEQHIGLQSECFDGRFLCVYHGLEGLVPALLELLVAVEAELHLDVDFSFEVQHLRHQVHWLLGQLFVLYETQAHLHYLVL